MGERHSGKWVLALAASALGLAVAGAASGAAWSDGVDVAAGEWRTISVARATLDGVVSSRTEVRDACVKDGILEPAAIVNEKAGCRAANLEVIGEEMSFELICESDGGDLRGKARYVAEGENGAGLVEMTGTVDGKPATMVVEMTSERIGDC